MNQQEAPSTAAAGVCVCGGGRRETQAGGVCVRDREEGRGGERERIAIGTRLLPSCAARKLLRKSSIRPGVHSGALRSGTGETQHYYCARKSALSVLRSATVAHKKLWEKY